MRNLLLFLFLAQACFAAELCIEAEDFQIISGWKVIKGFEGYFPARPATWSKDRMRDDEKSTDALATKKVFIPEDGKYNLWVRYESAYGFNSLFSIEIIQNKKTVFLGEFGKKDSFKYFPMDRKWLVQSPWAYHNTDYVYQQATVDLKKGEATIMLKKSKDIYPSCRRVIDLIYLTTDLSLEPGDDYTDWPRGKEGPSLMSRFKQPVFVKLRISEKASGPATVRLETRFFLVGYYMGPRPVYWFSKQGLIDKKPDASLLLNPGDETEWQKVELLKVFPGTFFIDTDQPAEILITRDIKKEKPATIKLKPGTNLTFKAATGTNEIVVSSGNSYWEQDILQGRPARLVSEYLQELTDKIEKYQVSGKKPQKIGLLSPFTVYPTIDFDARKLYSAAGMTGQYGACTPEVFGPEGEKFGFNRKVGYLSLQNLHLRTSGFNAIGRSCYEGNYEPLRKVYEKSYNELKQKGLGDLPQRIKLIEESSPPPLITLREWEKINEKFRQYLKDKKVSVYDVVGIDVLEEIAKGKKMTEEELWQSVKLGTGSLEESVSRPVLYYHSHYFRALLFAENNRNATKLIEEIFPKGTITHSGSFFPSTGRKPSIHSGVDPFLLFSERGVTGYSSEISWGLNTPDFPGVQILSYECALARSLSKYYSTPKGTYLITYSYYGYPPDFVKLGAYTFAAQCFDWINYFDVKYYPGMFKTVKEANYRIGMIEEEVLKSDVVSGKVAIGWLVSTDIWDIAQEKVEPSWYLSGNTIYPGERAYLYLLLRHLQVPVEVLGEQDLVKGYLKDYDVYILVGDHISRESAEALRKWVEGGGKLISVAGGGLKDQYNRELDVLKEVYGIKGANLIKREKSLRPKLELLYALPLDEIKMETSDKLMKMEVYGYRQSFDVDKGEVIGRYLNGEPAIVRNKYGKGEAIIIGTLPGTVYLKGAYPLKPFGRGGEDLSVYNYPDYNTQVREFIKELTGNILPQPPVYTDNPYVEANLLKDRERDMYYISLVNYSGKPVKGLKVVIDTDMINATAVEQVFSKITTEKKGNRLIIATDIDQFEFLKIK
ncbi:MAG: beta-galactosidase trimerization domain-containing protein [Candidatus Omnitrophica bacterium]|nr:beta-galactosidase trimerization domain-containing protein [Candidatus Omnitrophota bacterium]